MDHVILGYDTNQLIRDLGMEAESVGDICSSPVGLTYELACPSFGGGAGHELSQGITMELTNTHGHWSWEEARFFHVLAPVGAPKNCV